jgi:hypothetical protein
MNKRISQIAGEIHTSIDIYELAVMLVNNGLRAKLCDSSQYEGGTYIRVEEGATDFILEAVEGEYLVTGNASSCDRMYRTATQVSLVLITLDICHAFEVYDESVEVAYYLHHNCPQET